MRLVFAPWVKDTGERERGVEFEIWSGGVRAVGNDAVQFHNGNVNTVVVPNCQ